MQFFAGGAGGGGATGLPFPAGVNLPNAKYVSGFLTTTSTGNNDIYTVPSNKRAVLMSYVILNNATTVTHFPQIKISGTYYQLTGSTTTSNLATGNRVPVVPYVAEAAEIFDVNINVQPVNIWAQILEFDNTATVKSPKLTSLSNGDNTLYTVTTGKTSLLLNGSSLIPNQTASNCFGYWNNSGGSRNIKFNLVPNGGSTGTTNLFINTTAVTSASMGNFTGTPPITLNAGDFVNINTNAATATQFAWCTVVEY